jgi:hypothetical protein
MLIEKLRIGKRCARRSYQISAARWCPIDFARPAP